MLLSKREFTLSLQLQPFSPICYAVYPNMERGAFQALRVAHGDNLHLLREEKTKQKKKLSSKDGFKYQMKGVFVLILA